MTDGKTVIITDSAKMLGWDLEIEEDLYIFLSAAKIRDIPAELLSVLWRSYLNVYSFV